MTCFHKSNDILPHSFTIVNLLSSFFLSVYVLIFFTHKFPIHILILPLFHGQEYFHRFLICGTTRSRSHVLRLFFLLFGSLMITSPSCVTPASTRKCPAVVKSPGRMAQMITCPSSSVRRIVSASHDISVPFKPIFAAPSVISDHAEP